ncbi:MAG: DNA polymerase III subunit [Bacteroidota bacterium]
MQFSEIPGLEELKGQLINSFKRGKVAHAQLFAGSPGTAAFPMALAYATYLMCTNKQEQDACGTCANCVRMKKAVHPDVHWYFPKVTASDRGKYDKVLIEALPLWRTFSTESPFGSFEDWALKYGQENKNLQLSREDSRHILRNISMRSVEGGYKIIFIWGAEYMHPTAANAILKVLEEPPEKTIYLLVSFNYDSLLQTIISRTRLVNVPLNNSKEISDYLIHKKEVSEDFAVQLAKISQGKIGSAIRQMTTNEEMAYEQFRDWMLACWNRDLTKLVQSSEAFSKITKSNQRNFLGFSISLVRSAVLKKAGHDAATLNSDEDKFIAKYAEKLGSTKLEKMYQLLNEALSHLDRNSNPRITHLNLSLAIMKGINE